MHHLANEREINGYQKQFFYGCAAIYICALSFFSIGYEYFIGTLRRCPPDIPITLYSGSFKDFAVHCVYIAVQVSILLCRFMTNWPDEMYILV
jgi:hypothetical protein